MINVVYILFYITLVIFYVMYLYYYLAFFQQDHYHYRIFFKYFNDFYLKKPFVIIMIFIIMLYLFKEQFMIVVLISAFSILSFLLIGKIKKYKLKITKRIFRIVILHISNLLFLYIYIDTVLVSLILIIIYPLFILIICFLESLVNNLINKHYYKEAYRKVLKYQPFIIGITGSCGKTSLKNYIYECLKDDYVVYKTDHSYNTLNGISMTINNKLRSYNTIFILEMGASHKNDIKKITKYFPPNISIITDILSQHLSTFKSMDVLINEKMQIVKNMQDSGLVIVNGDNKYIMDNLYKYLKTPYKTYGFLKNNNYFANKVQITNTGINFMVNDLYSVSSNLLGRHNINNLLALFIVLESFNINFNSIKTKIALLNNYEHRLQLKKYQSLTILDDSYNSNYIGFINALEVLSKFKMKKIIITPGIVESGSESEIINKSIAQKIINICDFCYLVNNKNTIYYKNIFEESNYHQYQIVKAFQIAFNEVKNKECIVLIENDLTDYYFLK